MRFASGLIFVAIAALPYAAMVYRGGSPGATARGTQEMLTIMSPHRREVRLEYSRAFSEWMRARFDRNVEIVWLDAGGTSKMIKDLESRYEKSPGSPGVDLLFGGGVSPYRIAVERGWLQRVELPKEIMDGIPPFCAGMPVYDRDFNWYGVALSGFGIIYHRRLLEQLGLPVPESWEDLARPGMFSWLASGDPRSSGSVHMCYEIILQAYGFEKGWSIITRICANVHRFGEGGSAAPLETAARDVAAGMAIDQYAQTVINLAGSDTLGFVLPSGATVIDADAIGLLTNAPAKELGRLFIEFALSAEGQRLLYQPAGVNGQKYSLNRLPVRKADYDGPNAPAGRPYDFATGFRFDNARDAGRRDAVNALIGTVLIDAHDDLARAWKAASAPGAPPELAGRLCATPLTEAELDSIAGQWKDSRARVGIMRRWADEARKRYRSIQETAGGGKG